MLFKSIVFDAFCLRRHGIFDFDEPCYFGESKADLEFSAVNSSAASSTNCSVHESGSKRRSVQYPLEVEKAERRRKSDNKKWQKNEAKRRQNSGLSYKYVCVIKKDDGKTEGVYVTRKARKLLPPCNEKCRLKCSAKFTEKRRRKIFKEFWAMTNLQRQQDFVASYLELAKPKHRYQQDDSSHRPNNAYYLFVSDKLKLRVLQKLFNRHIRH